MVEAFVPFETQVPLEEEASMELLEAPTENTESNNGRERTDKDDTKDSFSNEEGCNSSRHRIQGDDDEDKSSADANSNSKGPYIVSLCGLPYSAITNDVMDFMEGCNILGANRGIHIASGQDGRPNGIAFVELASAKDVEKAREKHRSNMGKRYIEVRQVTEGDMQRMMDRWKPRRDPVNAVVLVKGLPYSCTADDIREFFGGLEIEPNGIMIVLDGRGRVCGDGFVHFTSARSVDLALQRHKEKIKHRYIEVYRSDLREMYPRVTNQLSPAGPWTNRRRDDDYGYRSRADDRSYGGGPMRRGRGRYDEVERRRYGGPYDRLSPHRSYHRGYNSSSPHYSDRSYSRAPHKEFAPPYRSKTGYSIHMRGLPYVVTKEQIIEFFSPVVPVDVSIEVLREGKRTGNANVDFATEEDVNEALRKDREKIDSRYIELYSNKNRC